MLDDPGTRVAVLVLVVDDVLLLFILHVALVYWSAASGLINVWTNNCTAFTVVHNARFNRARIELSVRNEAIYDTTGVIVQ